MYYVFYRLQRITLESWFTYLEQTPLDHSQQLQAGKTTRGRNQAKLTTRQRLEN